MLARAEQSLPAPCGAAGDSGRGRVRCRARVSHRLLRRLATGLRAPDGTEPRFARARARGERLRVREHAGVARDRCHRADRAPRRALSSGHAGGGRRRIDRLRRPGRRRSGTRVPRARAPAHRTVFRRGGRGRRRLVARRLPARARPADSGALRVSSPDAGLGDAGQPTRQGRPLGVARSCRRTRAVESVRDEAAPCLPWTLRERSQSRPTFESSISRAGTATRPRTPRTCSEAHPISSRSETEPGNREPQSELGLKLVRSRRFLDAYQWISVDGTPRDPAAVGEIWVRRERGKLGIVRTPDRVDVPGYFFTGQASRASSLVRPRRPRGRAFSAGAGRAARSRPSRGALSLGSVAERRRADRRRALPRRVDAARHVTERYRLRSRRQDADFDRSCPGPEHALVEASARDAHARCWTRRRCFAARPAGVP